MCRSPRAGPERPEWRQSREWPERPESRGSRGWPDPMGGCQVPHLHQDYPRWSLLRGRPNQQHSSSGGWQSQRRYNSKMWSKLYLSMNQFVTSFWIFSDVQHIINRHMLCCHCSVLWQGRVYMWLFQTEIKYYYSALVKDELVVLLEAGVSAIHY